MNQVSIMFRPFIKDSSPKPAPSKPKPIKQYGRKRSFLHLHTKSDIFTTAVDDESMDLDEFVPIPEERVPEPEVVQVANTKIKRQDSRARKQASRFLVRVPGLQEKTETKTARRREQTLAKRRAEDEAIAENDRAEKEFEQERARLYQELEELKNKGWIEQDRTLVSHYFPVVNSWNKEQDGRPRAKRCKRDVEDIQKAISQLTWDREQAVGCYAKPSTASRSIGHC